MFRVGMLGVVVLVLSACSQPQLPVYGLRSVSATGDTLYHTVGPFQFTNQDGQPFTEADLDGNVTVAEFFFANCPTICPTTTAQLRRVYARFEKEERLRILSHTVDPLNDTVPALAAYARKLGVTTPRWQFLYAPGGYVYGVAEKQYYSVARPDSASPGGYLHSGAFLLLDGQRRIRGIYDGTLEADVNRLMSDAALLLRQQPS